MVKKTLFLLFGLVVAVLLLDAVLYVLDAPFTGGFQLFTAGLTYPANLNSFIREIWFAETIACIFLPVALYVFRKRIHTPVLPWLLVTVVMLAGVVDMLSGTYGQPHHHLDLAYVLHGGASYLHVPGEYDTLLDSIAPHFLRAQLPIIAAIGAGYSIHYVLNYYKQRPRDNYPQKLS